MYKQKFFAKKNVFDNYVNKSFGKTKFMKKIITNFKIKVQIINGKIVRKHITSIL